MEEGRERGRGGERGREGGGGEGGGGEGDPDCAPVDLSGELFAWADVLLLVDKCFVLLPFSSTGLL